VEKDKTLRVLGRDTTEGLKKARAWITSSDPDLVADGIIVLRGAGGKDELQAAQEALQRAKEQERASQK